jgi:hypothetical protein
MRESTTIQLASAVIASLAIDEINGKSLLLQELIRNVKELETLMNNHYYSQKGKVHGIVIKENSLRFQGRLSGQFILNYTVNYRNGCMDLSYDHGSEMQIDFSISEQSQTMKLLTEPVQERFDEL